MNETIMRLGIDFDNTIVCYDQVFHQVAREQNLIPADLPVSKQAVRDYLRAAGKEDRWTEMQGYVYGPRLTDAQAFAGVLDFIATQVRSGVELFVVSHKTKHPYLGPQYDLHAGALAWLELNGFFDPGRIGLPRENVFLELTKKAKLERIATLGCTHFIDDLPELLAESGFPKNVVKVLFDPNGDHGAETAFVRARSWLSLPQHLQAA
jgi:hypothetical protein